MLELPRSASVTARCGASPRRTPTRISASLAAGTAVRAESSVTVSGRGSAGAEAAVVGCVADVAALASVTPARDPCRAAQLECAYRERHSVRRAVDELPRRGHRLALAGYRLAGP